MISVSSFVKKPSYQREPDMDANPSNAVASIIAQSENKPAREYPHNANVCMLYSNRKNGRSISERYVRNPLPSPAKSSPFAKARGAHHGDNSLFQSTGTAQSMICSDVCMINAAASSASLTSATGSTAHTQAFASDKAAGRNSRTVRFAHVTVCMTSIRYFSLPFAYHCALIILDNSRKSNRF